MQPAKYSVIVIIDPDLENDPKFIPDLAKQTAKHHMAIYAKWLPA
jgi:hypothetical protein